MNRQTREEFLGDMAGVDRLSAPDISNRSYVVSAEFEQTTPGATGVLLAWGSRFAGFVLYIKDDALCYEYVYSESLTHKLRVPFRKASGKAVVALRFDHAGDRGARSEEHTSELQSHLNLVCRLLLEKKNKYYIPQQKYQ